MRCCLCKLTKPMRMFPASCAVYRRGSCRSCNAMKARNKCANPLARKLESARVRYQRLGSVTLEDVAALYASYGVDITNEGDVKRTCICKIRRSGIGRAPRGSSAIRKFTSFFLYDSFVVRKTANLRMASNSVRGGPPEAHRSSEGSRFFSLKENFLCRTKKIVNLRMDSNSVRGGPPEAHRSSEGSRFFSLKENFLCRTKNREPSDGLKLGSGGPPRGSSAIRRFTIFFP